jgi:ribosomal protein S18 acetylase RimI-like enzyme
MDNKPLEIIAYQPQYANHFYNLNVAWLEKYFYVELYDKKVLSNPQEYIIDTGGFIFFAKYKNEIVGVVALINQKTFFELSKMAVSPKYQGLKIGEKLMNFCIEFATKQDWKSITLYSHRKLVPAINLYKKVGFKKVPLEENSHYKRSDIKMMLKIAPLPFGHFPEGESLV